MMPDQINNAANKPDVEISVLYQKWEDAPFNANTDIHKAVEKTLALASIPEDIATKKMEISFALVNDETIQTLNREYRNKDKPTNVLSFETGIAAQSDAINHPLGDVVISYETIEREAQEQNKKFQNHYIHMIIHGLLHLLGYDHIDDQDAEIMEQKEIEILQEFGIENPYI